MRCHWPQKKAADIRISLRSMRPREAIKKRGFLSNHLFLCCSKAFWKVQVLPLALSGDTCGFGSSSGVVGGMRSMTCSMGSSGSVTRCTGGGTGCRMLGITGGGMSGKCRSTSLAYGYFTTRPSAPCFNGFARAVVPGICFLEILEYVLCAVSSPDH